jgi:hypothetical protein
LHFVVLFRLAQWPLLIEQQLTNLIEVRLKRVVLPALVGYLSIGLGLFFSDLSVYFPLLIRALQGPLVLGSREQIPSYRQHGGDDQEV